MKTVRPGIRKKADGSYLVTKSIKKKRYYREHPTLSAAINWKNTFNPIANPEPRASLDRNLPANIQLNGINLDITFGEVWELYKKNKLGTLGDSIKYRKELKIPKFAASLFSVRMCQASPNVIDALLDEQKLLANQEKRYNFDEEISFLKSIFNWYAPNYDSSFLNPIRAFHKARGKIRAVPEKDTGILPYELEKFFDALPRFWQRLAFMQFYMAGRIQEAAGLQKYYVYRSQKIIKVAEVLTWVKSNPKVKKSTKTGKDSLVHINDHMEEIIDELESECPDDCPFLFHINGKPLLYGQIYDAYNQGLQKAGLPYIGTHILRYGMAGVAHDFMGDKGSQAATRHADMKMAQKYASRPMKLFLNPDNKAVVIHAETLFYKKKGVVGATICDQPEFKEG